MKKTLWNVLSIVAIANLVAVGALMAFLGATDRLSLDRVNRLRTALAETVPQEKARLANESVTIVPVSDGGDGSVVGGAGTPPPASAAVTNERLRELLDERAQQRLRADADLRRISDSLGAEFEELERRRAAFEAEKTAFERMRASMAAEEADAQFKKTIDTLAAMKAADSKKLLRAMIDKGGTQRVVSLLNSLDDRQRAKILTEFNKEDPVLAADLLEQLRTRGTVNPGQDSDKAVPPVESAGDAANQASAGAP